MPAIILPAKLDSLDNFIQFVSECAALSVLPPKNIHKIQLCLEEALVNVFSYAFPDKEGEVEVLCQDEEDSSFAITIIDSGIPFNVLEKIDPDLDAGIEERQVGGLGIVFMKTMMDEVEYERKENKNILTFRIKK